MSLPGGVLIQAANTAKRVAWGRRLVLWAKAAVTLAILVLLAHRVDGRQALAALLGADRAGLLLAIFVLFLSYGLGGWRWALILRGMGRAVRETALIAAFWAGAAVAQVVPSPLSDVMRIMFATEAGVDLRASAVSSIIERAVMILSLLALVAVTAPLVLPPSLWQAARSAGVILCLLAGGGALAMLLARRTLARLSSRWQERLRRLAADLRSAFEWRNLLPIIGSALASHGNLILAGAILGTAMHLPLSPASYLGAIPLGILGSVLPVSIGGWGVREGILVLVLVPLGVSETDALGYSVAFGICLVLSSLPGLALISRSVRRALLPATAREAPTP